MALPRPCLMLVTDRSLCAGADGLADAVEDVVQGGADAVQLREKSLPAARRDLPAARRDLPAARRDLPAARRDLPAARRHLPSEDLLTLARRLRRATLGRALLLVNGPLGVALTAEADGVHLPEGAPAVQSPREGFLVGRSIHSAEAARRAEAEGADYLIAGPVYETSSHADRDPAGLSLIREVTADVGVPVLAIGGVNAGRVEEVVRAGASGVAVISAVLGRTDRRAAAAELRRALDAAWAVVGAARR